MQFWRDRFRCLSLPVDRRRHSRMCSCLGVMSLALILSLASPCVAGGGPENLVLVVNADSPTSKLIANLYIPGAPDSGAKRDLPRRCPGRRNN